MQRTWATGAEHDHGPMEWVAGIGGGAKTDHVRAALDAAIAPEATIAQCQIGLLAVECVAYLHGGDADLDPLVHAWLRELHPVADEALRTIALDVLARLRAGSALAAHWRTELADREAEWHTALDGLRERLATAKRKPDPQTDPRIVALARSLPKAEQYLRVALVPYEITDEPIAALRVAPSLSVVLHYDVDDLPPVPVPIEHARGWNRSVKDLAKLAAKQTRKGTDIRTHILENAGFEIAIAFGSTPFTAGLLPYANLLFEEPAPHGILVGAPFAGCVAYHRIVDKHWNEAAVELVGQLREQYEVSPERISPQLWWLHKGKLVELPYAVVAEHTVIEPVEAFVAYVKKLG